MFQRAVIIHVYIKIKIFSRTKLHVVGNFLCVMETGEKRKKKQKTNHSRLEIDVNCSGNVFARSSL